jgi:hypothetical protein
MLLYTLSQTKKGERRSGTEFASISLRSIHSDLVKMNEVVCYSVLHIAFRVVVENSHVINHDAIQGKTSSDMRNLRFSQPCSWRVMSYAMLRHDVQRGVSDISKRSSVFQVLPSSTPSEARGIDILPSVAQFSEPEGLLSGYCTRGVPAGVAILDCGCHTYSTH